MNLSSLSTELIKTSEEWVKYIDENKSIPQDLGPYGYPQIKKEDVSLYFHSFGESLTKYSKLIEKNPDPFISKTIVGLQQTVSSLIANRNQLKSNPTGHIAALIQGLEQIRNVLLASGLFHNWGNKVSFPQGIVFEEVTEALGRSKKNLAEANSIKVDMEEHKKSLDAGKNEFQNQNQVLQQTLSDASTKLAQIQEVNAKVQAFGADYEKLKTENTSLVNLIANYKKEIASLEKSHSEQVEKVKSTLEAAERVGLAKSFSTRKDELSKQTSLWVALLILSVLGLFLVGVCIIHPDLKGITGTERLIALVTELPLTVPFIWIAWYSASHLGYTLRVSEDYSFKVASALALDGYKKEASIDKDLEKKLLDGAIGNFSENPIRIYSKNDVHGSPWHELLKHPEIKVQVKSLLDTVQQVTANKFP